MSYCLEVSCDGAEHKVGYYFERFQIYTRCEISFSVDRIDVILNFVDHIVQEEPSGSARDVHNTPNISKPPELPARTLYADRPLVTRYTYRQRT